MAARAVVAVVVVVVVFAAVAVVAATHPLTNCQQHEQQQQREHAIIIFEQLEFRESVSVSVGQFCVEMKHQAEDHSKLQTTHYRNVGSFFHFLSSSLAKVF